MAAFCSNRGFWQKGQIKRAGIPRFLVLRDQDLDDEEAAQEAANPEASESGAAATAPVAEDDASSAAAALEAVNIE